MATPLTVVWLPDLPITPFLTTLAPFIFPLLELAVGMGTAFGGLFSDGTTVLAARGGGREGYGVYWSPADCLKAGPLALILDINVGSIRAGRLPLNGVVWPIGAETGVPIRSRRLVLPTDWTDGIGA